MERSEKIYAAFFAAVANAPGIVTASRRYRNFEDVSPAERPALFIQQNDREVIQTFGMPGIWRLHATILIYVYSEIGMNPDATPATKLNNIIDNVIGALGIDSVDREAQTLGGMVTYVRIASGKTIITDEGILDPHGVAVIPIEILATI